MSSVRVRLLPALTFALLVIRALRATQVQFILQLVLKACEISVQTPDVFIHLHKSAIHTHTDFSRTKTYMIMI